VQVSLTFEFVDELLDAVMKLRDEMPSYAKAKLQNRQCNSAVPLPVASRFVKPVKDEAVLAHKSRFSKKGAISSHSVAEAELRVIRLYDECSIGLGRLAPTPVNAN